MNRMDGSEGKKPGLAVPSSTSAGPGLACGAWVAILIIRTLWIRISSRGGGRQG